MLVTIVVGGYLAKSPYPTASKAKKGIKAAEENIETAKSPVVVSRASSPSPKSPAAAVPAKRKRVPKVLDEEDPEAEAEVQPKKTAKKSKAASSRSRR